jgi:hypothetical protein
VAAVLEDVAWSMLPNDNITLTARISPANASLLNALAMQPLKRVIVTLSFAVYQYDPINSKYFTSFLSYKGVTSPKGRRLRQRRRRQADQRPLRQDQRHHLRPQGRRRARRSARDPQPHRRADPRPPIVNTPQQLLIQTSVTVKMIQPGAPPNSAIRPISGHFASALAISAILARMNAHGPSSSVAAGHSSSMYPP